MTQLKQTQEGNSSSSRPAELSSVYRSLSLLELTQTIQNPISLIALITHTILLSNSFTAKNQQIDSIVQTNQSILLTYSHPRSSLSFEFTLSKIGNRISIAGIAVEDDRLATLDLSISEYLDPTEFPLILTKEQQTSSIGLRSTTHLLDFLSLFVNRILNHLLPDLIPVTNPNNQRPPPPSSTTTSQPQTQPPPPVPEASEGRAYVHHQPSPLEIGRSDLDPIGTSNLHIPSLYNAPSGGIDARSGMIVGGNHPIFNNRRPDDPRRPGAIGGEFLPPGAVPPGARFDPFGPGISPAAFPNPRGFRGTGEFDPMGGLGQGLPLQNPHHGFSSSGRPDFGGFRPPGGHSSGYDDMFNYIQKSAS
ncbi:hypothetical protein H4Q26_014845 [Puccinia striiformis f. sp. tritici PST-130]|nr:hypothetical protein H4Q26_014845 [Puccinia striiformis f. sp. tritici PST-130]